MSLLICGDFNDGPMALDMTEVGAGDISRRIRDLTGIPVDQLSLFYDGESIQPSSLTRLKSGSAILAIPAPLRITVQRHDSNSDVHIQIPRLEALRWKTERLFDFCLYKAGMPYRNDGKYFFYGERDCPKRREEAV